MGKGGRPRLGLTYVLVGFPAGDLERIDERVGRGRRGAFVRDAVAGVLDGRYAATESESDEVAAEDVYEGIRASELVVAALTLERMRAVLAEGEARAAEMRPSEAGVLDDGRYGAQTRMVLDAVRRMPGAVARELAAETGVPEDAVGRALSRLAASGLIVMNRGQAVAI